MRLIASLAISLLLVLAVSLPTAATQEEADAISKPLLELFVSPEITPELTGTLADRAVTTFESLEEGTACRTYADLIASVLLLGKAITESSSTQVGVAAGSILFPALSAAEDACIAEGAEQPLPSGLLPSLLK